MEPGAGLSVELPADAILEVPSGDRSGRSDGPVVRRGHYRRGRGTHRCPADHRGRTRFPTRAVPDATVYRLLDTARFAPNGGNRQAWRVIVVKDPAAAAGPCGTAYLPGWYEYLAQAAAGLTPWAVVTDRELEQRSLADAAGVARAAADGPGGFAEHLDEVPVMLVLLADLAKSGHRRP